MFSECLTAQTVLWHHLWHDHACKCAIFHNRNRPIVPGSSFHFRDFKIDQQAHKIICFNFLQAISMSHHNYLTLCSTLWLKIAENPQIKIWISTLMYFSSVHMNGILLYWIIPILIPMDIPHGDLILLLINMTQE